MINPIKKIGNFRAERKKWKEAGFPVRSEEKIKEIFNICKSNDCGQFIKSSETEGQCGICGCYLKDINEGFNKIAWATTICPNDPPFWLPEVGFENIESKTVEIQVVEEPPPPPPPPNKKSPCGCG